MKVLLIHPADHADSGPWRNQRWDRVVDLGLAGIDTYARWGQRLNCSVETLSSAHQGMSDLRRIHSLLSAGDGRLVENHGLDLWEIFSILFVDRLESVIPLERLAESISDDAVYITRPCIYASVLQTLLNGRLQVFPEKRDRRFPKIGHYLDVLRKLSFSQIVDVLCDKYDPGQQLRAKLSRTRQRSERPVVLIPTAYINVSHTAIAYANMLPQQDFLLVSTRRSGWEKRPPSNVETAWLSSYAVVGDRGAEMAEIELRWRALLKDLLELPEFKILNTLGCFDRFPEQLHHGLEVRDAWRNVLDREPVQAVLCADDANPYTRIPLLLARDRGLPTAACHHGALDGCNALKRISADVILAKGKMEQDYLVQHCRVPAGKVEIAAPALDPSRTGRAKTDRPKKDRPEKDRPKKDRTQEQLSNVRNQPNPDVFRPQILFISEAYEVGNARAEEFYRDVLPRLADMALNTNRKLILKLHPAESSSERRAMVKRVLSSRQMAVTQVVAGPLTDALLDATWFGVTVLSTVAMECALRGIPCFLCKWLEYSFYGYIGQFIRFGVGIGLSSPGELTMIPRYLESYEAGPGVAANCWQTAVPDRLISLLTSLPEACATAAT
jgi:hypothetical protein